MVDSFRMVIGSNLSQHYIITTDVNKVPTAAMSGAWHK